MGKEGREWVWAALLVGLCAACGRGTGHRAVDAASRATGGWKELTSKHFVIQSDLPSSNAHALLMEYEESYAALRSALAGATDLSGKTHVVVFTRYSDYQIVARGGAGAFFGVYGSLSGTVKRIVMPVDLGAYRREVVLHELTHGFVAHSFPSAPTWANEGLAEFMSTARVEVQEVRTGAFPISVDPKRSKLTGTLLQKRLPGIEELTKYGNADFRGNPVAYAGAWFLVHSLILGTPQHRQAFDCYLRGLSSLAQKEPEVFAQCFPGRLPSELEAAYMARALASELPTQLAPLKVSIDKEYQARAMAPAEVEVLWGSLLPGTAAYDEGRLEHAQKAIDSDPTRPEGYIFRATLHMQASDVKAAKADLREALSVAPSDPQVLTALVNVLLRSGDLSEELDAAASKLAFEAKTASAYLSLAWYELARERPGKATVFGKEAVAGDAGCVGCLVVTALASYRAGQIDGAVSYQRMAVSLAGERATDRMQRTLDKYLKSQALGPAAGGS